MKLKGDWSGDVGYSVGDVLRYTDGKVYHLQRPCSAGVPPVNTLYWGEADAITTACALFALDAVDMAKAAIPTNISDEAITLSTETADYLITVDDSGETPELTVTAIEEEADS